MSNATLSSLSKALVEAISAGDCLDHCMRGVKFAAGLESHGISATVAIVQAVVQGQDAGMNRSMLHCWVEVTQSGNTMVMDATANKPVTTVKEYYESRSPSSIKRFSPARMHALLSEASRAEWFERSEAEIAEHTMPPPKIQSDEQSSKPSDTIDGVNTN